MPSNEEIKIAYEYCLETNAIQFGPNFLNGTNPNDFIGVKEGTGNLEAAIAAAEEGKGFDPYSLGKEDSSQN